MATVVQTVFGPNFGTTATITVTAGNTILLFVSSATITMSDSLNGNYRTIITNATFGKAIYYLPNSKGGANTVTASANTWFEVLEVSGIYNTISGIDTESVSTSASGTDVTTGVNAVPNNYPPGFLIAAGYENGGAPTLAGSAWHDLGRDVNSGCRLQYFPNNVVNANGLNVTFSQGAINSVTQIMAVMFPVLNNPVAWI